MTHAGLLFLQLTCVLAACRLVGWLAARVHQPRVVAEMLTGFLLGPSVVGWLAPGVHSALFPDASLPVLEMVSQIGLVLYMFCVGLEFRVDLVAHAGRRAIGLSMAGILGPLLLGFALGAFMLRQGGLFVAGITPAQASLFLGTALSITAFPVLARILSEHRILGTSVGTLTLSAGAIGDVIAWMLLAAVLGTISGHAWPAILAVTGGLAYAAVVIVLMQPVWRRLTALAEVHDRVSSALLSGVLGCLMLGAWTTETLGIHSVFGAFMFGASLPRGVLTRELRRMIEPVTSTLLVPLFFVYAGLHTELRLVSSLGLWALTALVFLVACLGKTIPCWLGARLTGASSREALAMATLMNARGMVELILINIGLARGIITPTLYTMLVLMAIGTTLMTGPLFGLVWHDQPSLADERHGVRAAGVH
jgi:Kef-type K+ transport system membrane component KefB